MARGKEVEEEEEEEGEGKWEKDVSIFQTNKQNKQNEHKKSQKKRENPHIGTRERTCHGPPVWYGAQYPPGSSLHEESKPGQTNKQTNKKNRKE